MDRHISTGIVEQDEGRDLPVSVRVDARMRLQVGEEAGRFRIEDRHEAGALRFRMPRRSPDAIEAMMVNVAGGLAGGDRLDLAVGTRGAGALVVSSATAERIYRSGGDETSMRLALSAADRSRLIWLPNETILHHGARLRRTIHMDIAAEATLLFGEVMQLGRIASGERWRKGALCDRWEVRLAGKLVFAEAMRLEGAALAHLEQGALLGPETGFIANLLLVAPDCAERLVPLREALAPFAMVRGGASAHCGLVFARLVSHDDVALQKAFLAAVRAMAGPDVPLPRLLLQGQDHEGNA